MEQDPIDIVRTQWSRERPDLDASGIEVVARILLLSNHLKRSAARQLARHALNLWAYDVLATLRRQGPPFQLSPTELSRSALLSPGAMTNRLDRLEASGYIERRPDPDDRRGLLIALTPSGLELTDAAVEARFEEAISSTSCLSTEERNQLSALLHKLIMNRPRKPSGAASRAESQR
ncbi:MAG: MarR family transcriptional regulator [bacterium]